jgi:CDP-paratose synthetase
MSSTVAAAQRTILVTGATGFLGGGLTLRFVAAGYGVVVLKRSGSDVARIRSIADRVRMYDVDRTPLERIFDEQPIDAVVHCATNYGRNGVSAANVLETNLILPLRLLQLASDRGARAFVNSDTILDPRINYYSLSKSQFVEWLLHLSARLACVNVALEHFYGPGDNPSKFLSSIIRDLVRGVPAIALTPGEQRRDFIYIDDAIDAFSRILEYALHAPAGFSRFEVGTSELITIREVVQRIHRLAGTPATALQFGVLPYRENEVMESQVDSATLRRLGWAPRISLDEGLRMTIEMERKQLPA